MKKIFSICTDITDDEQKKLDEISRKYAMDENEIFFLSIQTGFVNNAKDYKSAFKTGLELQEKILEKMPKAARLQDLANKEHAPANDVQENLIKNMNIDDSLMDEIIKEVSQK